MENHRDRHLTHPVHLTDEQFTDLLLGTSPAAVTAHLSACPQCAQEAERVSGAIGSFEQQSRLWAERRAASLPARSPDSQPAYPWLYRPQAWAGAGLALALALGIGISLRVDHARTVQQLVAAKVQLEVKVSPTILKSDNALLSAIDGELRADESVSAGMYGLSGSSRGVRSRVAKRTSN